MGERSATEQSGDGYLLAPFDQVDLAPLAALWTASWQAVMPQLDFAARRDWFLEHVAALLAAGAQMICAFAEGDRLAGFILLLPDQAYLEQIAVHPDHFGCGLGTRLVAAAKSLCPAGLTLDVNADNPRALRFYEREGFVRIDTGRNPMSGLATWKLSWPAPSFAELPARCGQDLIG